MVPLKYLSNVWRTVELPLINCEINFILTCSKSSVVYNASANPGTTLAITNTKLNVAVVILSSQDKSKLLPLLKSGFKRKISWNNYQSKTATQGPDQYLYYLNNSGFQGVNILFVLTFDVNDNKIGHSR